MIKERNPNLDILLLAVDRLGELKDEVVFLGGCTTGLLITDQAAPPVRETKDVDVIVEVVTLAEYYELSDRLRNLGFTEDQSEEAPLCRWLIDDLILDVMPTDEKVLGFSNQWYKAAMQFANAYKLPDSKVIKVVTAPYFLATKIEAFEGRGNSDYMLSHDLEDIISIIDGRPEIVEEVFNVEKELKEFLIKKFRGFINKPRFIEALPTHLLPDEASQARLPLIQNRLNEIVNLK
jgi:predicted nucleotidyltransferase